MEVKAVLLKSVTNRDLSAHQNNRDYHFARNRAALLAGRQ